MLEENYPMHNQYKKIEINSNKVIQNVWMEKTYQTLSFLFLLRLSGILELPQKLHIDMYQHYLNLLLLSTPTDYQTSIAKNKRNP